MTSFSVLICSLCSTQTLINFIVTKLTQHATPDVILDELRLVLDDEADTFVMKMWRMLVFHSMKLSQS